ncbi:hypothetical protein [Undibacterium oligocarboniphilum]|uniref:Alkylhydroperoxidase n=1 Tax=Undibacterium oligocarboniphilum TaxID=666702 RepID=A0A850QIN5_9BURK|nr:hypothetical protein [Undibacterium oligocarboniphilum]MBC3871673.1 hypothetical protein [Undibacterium oligocarboniphilum]NVO79138.1 hypothetical protein [Undibacterium oligocarboniphilum]
MTQYPAPELADTGLQAEFSETELTSLTAGVAAINAWNRIAGDLKFSPSIE